MSWALQRQRPDVLLAYTGWANVSSGLVSLLSPATVCIWGQRDCECLRGDPVERFAYRRVAAVICNAMHEINYLGRTLGATPAPISVVPNGVALPPALKSRREWREHLNIDANATVVVMVANFRPEKNHVTVLRAWRRILDSLDSSHLRPRLLLAGAYQESFSEAQDLARELRLLDTVTFLGQVHDISGLLKASDIGILSSNYEGMSNALIEYMASGLPVVATDVPGNREVLGDHPRQPYCTPGDVDELADRLCSIILDSTLRRELARLNRHCASQRFSVPAMCEATVKILHDVLANKSNNARGELGRA